MIIVNKKRLVVVPARGGSKRIPNKNIKDFCGKPIIYYSLKAASNSKLFSKIHISTDSKEIFDTAKIMGFEPDFMRPKSLSEDDTPLMPVMRFVADEYRKIGEIFDEVWLLMSCAPLINSSHLVEASKKFHKNNAENILIAVSEYPAPTEWAFSINNKGLLSAKQPGMFSYRSQDLKNSYYDAGAFMIFPPSKIYDEDSMGNDNDLLAFELPRSSSVDIDEESDWRFAELLFSAQKK